jgi:hypothetical protein
MQYLAELWLAAGASELFGDQTRSLARQAMVIAGRCHIRRQ